MAYRIDKFFNNTSGLDLRSSDLIRRPGAATEINNLLYRQTGAMSKRKGYQYRTSKGVGGGGMVRYNNIDISTGVITEELLSVDDNLNLYTALTFTVTYTGSDTAYYDLYLDSTGSFFLDLYDDNVRVLNEDLGTGLGASDSTVDQLVTAINAVTNFSSSVSGSPSTPAAFIPVARNTTISSSGTTVSWYEWSSSATPGTYTNPFTTHYAARNTDAYENATFAQLNDVLYISNGYDDLHKYDGNRVYKAGLPVSSITSSSAGAGGSLTYSSGEDYRWKVTHTFADPKENILESAESDEVTHTTAGAGESRNIVFSNILAASGYSCDQAVVDGIQAGVTTITVDSGHTLLAGDQIFINDTLAGAIVQREVSSVTATTVVISGAVVSVADNAIIGQVKYTLWRTKADGSIFYVARENINDNSTATTTEDDTESDASLVVQRTEPIRQASPPPKCRYIDVWRSQLVMTGNRESVNTVYYSDIDTIEGFPVAASFTVGSRSGGPNTAIRALDNNLFVFKDESVTGVTGDFGTDSFRLDALTDEGIGCISHNTIKEIKGKLWFLGNQGVYSINGQGVNLESVSIKPKFDNASYVKRKASSFHWIDRELYVLVLPSYSDDGSSNNYLNESATTTLVYDFFRGAWLEWDSFNVEGGMAEYNDCIYFNGRVLDTATGNTSVYNAQVLENDTIDDYADHADAISFSYKGHWEALGEPSVFKKFLRIKVHSLDASLDDFEGNGFQLGVATDHDYKVSTVSSLTLDFTGGASGWGNSAWGNFPWGEARLAQLKSKLSSKKAKSIRVSFSNSTRLENVLISGYSLEVAAPYDLQIKE